MNDAPGLDFNQIAAFEAVAKTGSFSAAAVMLGSAQSSVSQQISRLEAQLDRLLIKRSTRRVSLTRDGEALLIYARAMLGLADRTRRQFAHPPAEGHIRLGMAEDFALVTLHKILSIFRDQHPNFVFTIVTGLNSQLFRALDADEIDVVLAKRVSGRKTGELVMVEPMVWTGNAKLIGKPSDPIPLVTYPRPSETRDIVISALERAGRTWSVVAESIGIAGQRAAVLGGFGLAAFSKRFVPKGIEILGDNLDLPALDDIEFVIDHRAADDETTRAFVAVLKAVAASFR